MTRSRNWPSLEDVSNMKEKGCHIVPKPSYTGNDFSWRFSFSRQERDLAHLVPANARIIYLILKILFKKKWKARCNYIKSSPLKTWFLWFVETQELSTWKGEPSNKIIAPIL